MINRDGGQLETIYHYKEDPAIQNYVREHISGLSEFRFEVQAEKYINFIYRKRHSRL